MLGVMEEDEPLDAVMRAPRFHHGGLPDELFYESGIGRAVVSELLKRGHAVQEAGGIGRVNALRCPEGIVDAPGDCRVQNDPRGFGLSAFVQ